MAMKRKLKPKRKASLQVSRVFGLILGLVSMVGFLAIILHSLFKLPILLDYYEPIILSLLGIGLVFEGKLFKLFRTAKDGVSSQEVTKWITSLIGIVILASGIFAFIGFTTPEIEAVKGIGSLIALVIIGVEIFLVD